VTAADVDPRFGAPPAVVERLQRMMRAGQAADGPLPVVSDPAWLTAPPVVVAGVLARAALAWLAEAGEPAVLARVVEADEDAARRWRSVAHDLSAAVRETSGRRLDWSTLPEIVVPMRELRRRREPWRAAS
jgi:hypothetical protein